MCSWIHGGGGWIISHVGVHRYSDYQYDRYLDGSMGKIQALSFQFKSASGQIVPGFHCVLCSEMPHFRFLYCDSAKGPVAPCKNISPRWEYTWERDGKPNDTSPQRF
ncbi:hypothetical protein AN958_00355 [Leucoagaricus sp. SymC.cos]|nr:hypothetical protein AN958_00355 [Leucoagaricus sp. SymC.cos]